MSLNDVLKSIDAEIARLQQARQLLTLVALTVNLGPNKSVGRPGSNATGSKPKRKFSAAHRKRLAEAQRKRWAAVRKVAK